MAVSSAFWKVKCDLISLSIEDAEKEENLLTEHAGSRFYTSQERSFSVSSFLFLPGHGEGAVHSGCKHIGQH